MTDAELRPIETNELLEAIGELYVQTRFMRRIIASLQQQRAQQQQASNGLTEPAGSVEA